MNFYQQRLALLRDLGFSPKVIYDIGAWRGEWSKQAEPVFRDSNFYLFEANKKHIPVLEKQRHPFFIALLGDQEKPTTFYTTITEGFETGDSIFKENTNFYSEKTCREIVLPMKTLSSLVEKHQIPTPDLIKIDVQGSEKLVIQGGINVVLSAQAVILEVQVTQYNQGAPLFVELANLMNSLDFQMVDLLEASYLPNGELLAMDVLFIKKSFKSIKTGVLF